MCWEISKEGKERERLGESGRWLGIKRKQGAYAGGSKNYRFVGRISYWKEYCGDGATGYRIRRTHGETGTWAAMG